MLTFVTHQDGQTDYKAAQDVRYDTLGPRSDRPGQLFPIGGVPLGIGIANDIFEGGLKQTPASLQPSGRNKCGDGAFVGGPAPGTNAVVKEKEQAQKVVGGKK